MKEKLEAATFSLQEKHKIVPVTLLTVKTYEQTY